MMLTLKCLVAATSCLSAKAAKKAKTLMEYRTMAPKEFEEYGGRRKFESLLRRGEIGKSHWWGRQLVELDGTLCYGFPYRHYMAGIDGLMESKDYKYKNFRKVEDQENRFFIFLKNKCPVFTNPYDPQTEVKRAFGNYLLDRIRGRLKTKTPLSAIIDFECDENPLWKLIQPKWNSREYGPDKKNETRVNYDRLVMRAICDLFLNKESRSHVVKQRDMINDLITTIISFEHEYRSWRRDRWLLVQKFILHTPSYPEGSDEAFRELERKFNKLGDKLKKTWSREENERSESSKISQFKEGKSRKVYHPNMFRRSTPMSKRPEEFRESPEQPRAERGRKSHAWQSTRPPPDNKMFAIGRKIAKAFGLGPKQ